MPSPAPWPTAYPYPEPYPLRRDLALARRTVTSRTVAAHRAAAAVTAASSATPRPVSSAAAGEWASGSRTRIIQSATSQLSHHAATSDSQRVRAERSQRPNPASRQARSARRGGITRLTPGTSQPARSEEAESFGRTRRSQLRYAVAAMIVAATSTIINTANVVTAPTTARAPGAFGSPPNAAISWASRRPRARSKTTTEAVATTCAARAAYTNAADRFTADETDRMPFSPPHPCHFPHFYPVKPLANQLPDSMSPFIVSAAVGWTNITPRATRPVSPRSQWDTMRRPVSPSTLTAMNGRRDDGPLSDKESRALVKLHRQDVRTRGIVAPCEVVPSAQSERRLGVARLIRSARSGRGRSRRVDGPRASGRVFRLGRTPAGRGSPPGRAAGRSRRRCRRAGSTCRR